MPWKCGKHHQILYPRKPPKVVFCPCKTIFPSSKSRLLDTLPSSVRPHGPIPDDDAQDPAIDEEESERGAPEPRGEGGQAEELELVGLLEPDGLGQDPSGEGGEAEGGGGEEG